MDEFFKSYLVSEKEAATLLGFTPRFLQSRRLRGDGPQFVRISSRAVRYRVKDLQEWVENRLRVNNNKLLGGSN